MDSTTRLRARRRGALQGTLAACKVLALQVSPEELVLALRCNPLLPGDGNVVPPDDTGTVVIIAPPGIGAATVEVPGTSETVTVVLVDGMRTVEMPEVAITAVIRAAHGAVLQEVTIDSW